MAGKCKCRLCGEWIEPTEERVKYKNGYVHDKCFNAAVNATVTKTKERLSKEKKPSEAKPKPQVELKEGLSEEEYKEKQQLCDYIRKLTGKDLPVKVYKLIEDYKKKYKFTYSEMMNDMIWYFDICNKQLEGDGIGIVPYCHTEAQEYYASLKRTQESCQNIIKDIPDMYKTSTAAVSKRGPKRTKEIDMAAIGSD